MKLLLNLAHQIDRLNSRIGQFVYWLILAMVLISAGNAISRKAFDLSSNAFLEIQWTLFSAVFLLAAGYTLLKNEHVRIDVLANRFGPRVQAWIDIIGGLFFLLPLTLLVLYHAWPFFWDAFLSEEMSNNPGGLILWPGKLLIPLGFALLFLQGCAEVIKRVGFLRGIEPPELPAPSPAEELILRDEAEGQPK